MTKYFSHYRRIVGRIRVGEESSVLGTTFRPVMLPTQSAIQYRLEALFSGVKLLGPEINHSPPSSATSSWHGV
jgi:hypothetical protein